MGSSRETVVITSPEWVGEVTERHAGVLQSDEERMAFVIALSRQNVERGGGPFGAAVFSGDTLIAAGVNQVLDSGLSIAHAEIMALMYAQHRLRGAPALPDEPYVLFASTEPCCQCFGALIWSGVTRLVCGATTDDAEIIGFDEGPKPDAWPRVLEERGIAVRQGVQREAAKDVLEEYRRRGGIIYGLRHPGLA